MNNKNYRVVEINRMIYKLIYFPVTFIHLNLKLSLFEYLNLILFWGFLVYFGTALTMRRGPMLSPVSLLWAT